MRGGERVLAPSTFELRVQATDWLNTQHRDLATGDYLTPDRTTLGEYAERWIDKRHLTGQSRQLYEWLNETHISALHNKALVDITPLNVREWYFGIEKSSSATSAYQLLRAMMNTAVSDRLVRVNPCAIRGAGVKRPEERKIATIAEVNALADAITPRLRLFVLLACWCQLRRGELLGLRPSDIEGSLLTVRNTRVLMMNGSVEEKGPKTEAGKRTLSIPPFLLPEIERHLQAFPGPYLFMGVRGKPMTRNSLYENFWRAREKVGVDLTIHDLRHTGLTLAAETGATVAELMKRAGHTSPITAMRYQHATAERDREVARRLHDMGSPTIS